MTGDYRFYLYLALITVGLHMFWTAHLAARGRGKLWAQIYLSLAIVYYGGWTGAGIRWRWLRAYAEDPSISLGGVWHAAKRFFSETEGYYLIGGWQLITWTILVVIIWASLLKFVEGKAGKPAAVCLVIIGISLCWWAGQEIKFLHELHRAAENFLRSR